MELNHDKIMRIWEEFGLTGLEAALKGEKNPFAVELFDIIMTCWDILRKNPDQLLSQLHARVHANSNLELRQLVQELERQVQRFWFRSLFPLPSKNGSLIAEPQEHHDFIGSIVCYSNEEFITSSEDARMITWDLKTAKPIKFLFEHAEPINWMSLAPDGKHLVSASDDYKIKIWDIENWTVVNTLEGHEGYVSKVMVSKTGRIVSVSKDQTVRVWDFTTGEQLSVFEGHNSWVYMLAISPDGNKVITASVNNTIIVWDIITMNRVATLVDGGGDVEYVMGLILGGKNRTGIGHKNYPVVAQWLDNGTIITAAEDIIIWDDLTFQIIKKLKGHPWKIHGLVFFDQNRKLITAAHSIKIWDMDSGEELLSLIGHDGQEIFSAAITPNEEYLLTGDKKGILKIWNISELLKPGKITGHLSHADSITISLDGSKIATGGFDKTAIIWDASTGKPIHYLKDHSDFGVKIQGFRANGHELITSSRGQVLIWNVDTGNLIKKINLRKDLYDLDGGILYDNDTKLFGSAICYRPTSWDLEKGRVKAYDITSGVTKAGVTSKDGRLALLCTYPAKMLDGQDEYKTEEEEQKGEIVYYPDEEPWEPNQGPVILWDLKKEKLINEFWLSKDKIPLEFRENITHNYNEPRYYPSAVLFSPDEKRVFAGFSEGSLSIWNVQSGNFIKYIKAANDFIAEMFWMPNGTLAIIATKQSTVNLWDADSFEPIESIFLPCEMLAHIQVLDEEYLIAVTDQFTFSLISIQKKAIASSFSFTEKIQELKTYKGKVFVTTHDGYLYGFEPIYQR